MRPNKQIPSAFTIFRLEFQSFKKRFLKIILYKIICNKYAFVQFRRLRKVPYLEPKSSPKLKMCMINIFKFLKSALTIAI